MRTTILLILLFGSVLALSAPVFAQEKSTATPKKDFISRADADSDGKVSRDEFLNYERRRAEAAFDRLDANKDGSIDKKEVAKIKEEWREKKQKKSGTPPAAPKENGSSTK